MWNFTRSRQTAGNICLVLFTAFLFTILVAPFGMVGNAEAASFVDKNGAGVTSKSIFTGSNGAYSILVNLAVDPLTDPDFNTMQIKFDFGNNKVISVYANEIVQSVYTTAYAKVYTLVYTPAAEFQNPVYTTIYGKLYVGDNPYQNLILAMNIKPPEVDGDLTVSAGSGAGSAALEEGRTELVFDEGESLDVATRVEVVDNNTNLVTIAGVPTDLTNLTVNGQAEDITQVTAIGGQAFVVEKAVALQSGIANEPIVITNAAVNGSSVSIPDGTKVMTKAGWNGKISPPTVVPAAAVTGTPPAGYNVTTTKVIKFGSDDVPLLFDKPVTFVLPNTTGAIAYRVPGSSTWVRITNQAGGIYDNPTAPAFPQEAYISNGTDTKIITWHATEFAPVTVVSSGGGGGGLPAVKPPVVVTSNFGDIASHWAKDDIELLFGKGIIAGLTEKKFAPDATITRAQFATLLVKALGLADVKPANATFKDVKSGAWYYGTVEAAVANKLVAGSNGIFNPDGNITRQEMAVMVANALKAGGKSVTATPAELDKFSDKSEIASWAQGGVAIAVKEGIITGRTASTVVPKANATRAEGTVMIKKVLESLGKL